MATAQQYGMYLPQTYILDVHEIYQTDVTSPQFKELLVRLYQNVNSMLLVLNNKHSGLYPLQEFVNGKRFFPTPGASSNTAQVPALRQVLQMTLNCGALPNNTTNTIAHGINCTANTTFIDIYGASSDTAALLYIPLPFVSLSGNSVEISVDDTYVYITTESDMTAYATTYIILEYLQN